MKPVYELINESIYVPLDSGICYHDIEEELGTLETMSGILDVVSGEVVTISGILASGIANDIVSGDAYLQGQITALSGEFVSGKTYFTGVINSISGLIPTIVTDLENEILHTSMTLTQEISGLSGSINSQMNQYAATINQTISTLSGSIGTEISTLSGSTYNQFQSLISGINYNNTVTQTALSGINAQLGVFSGKIADLEYKLRYVKEFKISLQPGSTGLEVTLTQNGTGTNFPINTTGNWA